MSVIKLWRYNGFDPDTRRLKTTNNPDTGQPWEYKNPEIFAAERPGDDYSEIEIPNPATELRDKVEQNPDTSYRIYKYLLEDVAAKNKDVNVPPKGIEYIKDVSPKLQKKVENIDARGALVNVEWWAYDDVSNTWIEPVLKVWVNYYYKQDAGIKASESILSREVFRQWILENGTYKELGTIDEIKNDLTDVKYTYKRYHKVDDPSEPDYNLSSREGKRRRENIQRLGEERFVTLVAALITGWNSELAEILGLALIRKYANEYTEYKENGDRSFVDIIDANGDANILTDILGNVIMEGVSSLSLLSTPIPSTVNHPLIGTIPIDAIVPNASSVATIRDFIVEKYKGEI